MERIGVDLNGGASGSDDQDDVPVPSPEEQRLIRQRLNSTVDSLVHSCQCRDNNCKLSVPPTAALSTEEMPIPSCQKMKRVMAHSRGCREKTTGGCRVCKQLIALCCYHAKHCQESARCPVPFCAIIKQKLREQQQQQLLVEYQMMQRRMAAMRETLEE